ncbi:MAG: GtrA family protein [Polyangia bacterium]
MLVRLKPLLTPRFVKFCAVGASGVAVNLGCLALLADLFGMQQNMAAALAIEVSINTNFAINEGWTFRDRRGASGVLLRWWRFHLVSFAGAAIQWLVFVVGNSLVATLGLAEHGGLVAQGGGGIAEWVERSILRPPDVGGWKYASQLAGIAAATVWNFFANFYWTWRHGEEEQDNDRSSQR